MGMLAANPPRGLFARRGGTMFCVTALHVAAVGMLMNAQYGGRADPAPDSIKVFNLTADIRPDQPAPEIAVELAPPPPMVVPLIHIELQAPPPTAITPPPPSPPAAPRQAVLRDDAPVLLALDQVDYERRPQPRYPAHAKKARLQGTVYLRVLIGPDGAPREVTIDRSSGHEALDVAARDAVLKSLFRPHRENGEARLAVAIVPVEFSLTSRSS